MDLKEILQKEEEKHQLRYIGIIKDWVKTVEQTERGFMDTVPSFAERKLRVLDYFYRSILAYERFIREEKTANPHLKKHHFRKTATYVSHLHKGQHPALDQELKTSRELTFAYHFTALLYEEMYARFCRTNQTFGVPEDTDAFFRGESERKYPLEIAQVIRQLSLDDASFWERCARYLQVLSGIVVNSYLQKGYGHTDLIKDDTWTESYEVLRKRLVLKQGNIPVFETGRDFRNYAIKVCRLLTLNMYRKYAYSEDYIEDFFHPYTSDGEEDEEETTPPDWAEEAKSETSEPHDEASVLDVNTDNAYEVAHAVSIILLNAQHPLYKRLIHGVEDKVNILIDKTINEMSYREIILELYGEGNLSEAEFERAVVKARKDYERVKKILCDRLKEMIKNKPPEKGTRRPAAL
ncbi:MAG: hypothetical protein LBQ73_10915 [Tannerellaceae bacterium]|jgi:hypothetical protein|nr:hypothetical protein [Tannerellaceae bacterium]